MRRKQLLQTIEEEIAKLKEQNSRLDSQNITDAASICFNSGSISAYESLKLKIENDKIADAIKHIPSLDHEEREEEELGE